LNELERITWFFWLLHFEVQGSYCVIALLRYSSLFLTGNFLEKLLFLVELADFLLFPANR